MTAPDQQSMPPDPDGSGRTAPSPATAGEDTVKLPPTTPPHQSQRTVHGATDPVRTDGGTGRAGDFPTPGPDPASEIDPTSQIDPVSEIDGTSETVELSTAVAELTKDDLAPATRRRLLGRIVGVEIRERGARQLMRPKVAMRWVVDAVSDVAPHIPVRDLDTLRRHHGGLDGDALAERLIRNAARATTGIGAASGGVAAIEWAVTPTLLTAPMLIAAETVAVVAVEMKLIGELHEVYRQPVSGTGSQRAVQLVQAWAARRGVNPLAPGAGMAAALGTATRKELRDRLMRRFSRNWTTLGPLLTGAAVAGFVNRRATLALGEHIQRDLRRRPMLPG